MSHTEPLPDQSDALRRAVDDALNALSAVQDNLCMALRRSHGERLVLYRYGSLWTTMAPGLENHATEPDESATFVREDHAASDQTHSKTEGS